MTKEELAEAYVKKNCDDSLYSFRGQELQEAYLAGYETMEKEKGIVTLMAENAGLKDYCDKYVETILSLRQNVADLEKDNAELKAKNKWYSEQVCNKECAEVWGKLTEAKELIEDIYDLIPSSHSEYYKDVMERARQFLKEEE